MKIRNPFTITALVLAFLSAAVSCDDPDNLYGKRKEMQILDETGNPVTRTNVSVITTGTLSIVGGMGDNHTIEVQDESILRAEYTGRGAGHSHIPTETIPAAVILFPKQLGSTIVSITDNDTDETLHVQVDVVHQYIGLTVSGSTAEELEDGNMILFLQDKDMNEYRIVSRDGNDFRTLDKGEYHFEMPREDIYDTYINPGDVVMTLRNEDGEIFWKITDADNNRNESHLYICDVLAGMGLPDEIITKTSPVLHYPELFLFTDVLDVNRHFMTGRMEVIEYTFD